MNRPLDPRDALRLRALEHELAREGHPHPSPESIARLMDQEEDATADRDAAEHIVRCRRCYALYAEMVHAEIGARMDVDGAEVDEVLAARAMAIAGPRPAPRAAPRSQGFGWGRVLALGFSVVGLVFLFVAAPWRGREESVPPELAVPVLEALVFALPPGWVLDGRIPESPQEVYRDGNGVDDLDPIIEQLEARYRSTRHSVELVELLVLACLADGNLESAEAFLRQARTEFPHEPRIELLQAAFLARRNRLPEAEKILLAWSEKSRNATPFLVDLALLRQAEDNQPAALAILKEVEAAGKRAAPFADHLRSQLQPE